MKEHSMRAGEVSGKVSIDFTQNMPLRVFRAIVMLTGVGTILWLVGAASSWSYEATLEEAAE